MQKKGKILVIRFNSIGDIILTTPVLKSLAEQGYEVHYVMKASFGEVLAHCPYLKKTWFLKNSMKDLIAVLKKENFDYVVDLHNNIRSKRLKQALGKKSFTFKKDRFTDWVMIKFGIWRKPKNHIVKRFLDTISPINQKTQEPKVEFFIDRESPVCHNLSLPEKYHVICVGAAYYTKQMPNQLIAKVIDNLDLPVILIGGPGDFENGEHICQLTQRQPVNLCGKLSINDSALIIDGAVSVLSGDTGMMHVADALGKKMVAVFGSTHPLLGYYPFNSMAMTGFQLVQNEDLDCRPCTKQGRHSCPKGHFKCMNDLNYSSIVDKM